MDDLAKWRRIAAYLGSWAVGATYVVLWVHESAAFHALPALYVLAFFLAPALNDVKSVAARLAARAFWLQSSVMYTLIGGYAFYRWTARFTELGTYTFRWEHLGVAVIWAGPILALLAVGARGLDTTSRHFTPTRFRKTMLASLVLGAADLIALSIFATITLHDRGDGLMDEAAFLVLSALAMGVALFGLFRLRVWGLLACVAANVVVAVLALSGALGVPEVFAGGLVATAIGQLLIPIPMIREILAGLKRGALQRSDGAAADVM